MTRPLKSTLRYATPVRDKKTATMKICFSQFMNCQMESLLIDEKGYALLAETLGLTMRYSFNGKEDEKQGDG